MKKLLSLLSTSVVLIPTLLTTVAAKNINVPAPQAVRYSVESFKNVVKILNQKDNKGQNLDSEEIDSILDNIVPNFYFDSISEKTGQVEVWDSQPRNDVKTIKSYHNQYINNSPYAQTRLTQSRTEEITENHNFSMSLTENIVFGFENSLKGKLSIPLGQVVETIDFSFSTEVGNTQQWSNSKTISITETVPSQQIIQSPWTILYVEYLIQKGTWDYHGVARFPVKSLQEKVFKIPFFYLDKAGRFDYMVWHQYSLGEIVETLKAAGYHDELLLENTDEYSVLSVDSLDHPYRAFINLPLSWSSEASGLLLEHHEEPIK